MIPVMLWTKNVGMPSNESLPVGASLEVIGTRDKHVETVIRSISDGSSTLPRSIKSRWAAAKASLLVKEAGFFIFT